MRPRVPHANPCSSRTRSPPWSLLLGILEPTDHPLRPPGTFAPRARFSPPPRAAGVTCPLSFGTARHVRHISPYHASPHGPPCGVSDVYRRRVTACGVGPTIDVTPRTHTSTQQPLYIRPHSCYRYTSAYARIWKCMPLCGRLELPSACYVHWDVGHSSSIGVVVAR